MTDVEERIINLIVEVAGIQRKRVQLSSRLVDDIGMDGDDAIDFFEKFGQHLHVDLEVLYKHWDNHFIPEAFGGMSIGYLVIIGASVVVGDLVHAAVSRIPAWLAMIGVIVLSFGSVASSLPSINPQRPLLCKTLWLLQAPGNGSYTMRKPQPICSEPCSDSQVYPSRGLFPTS